jgi:hypothetical protein
VSDLDRLAEVREALRLRFPCRHWEAGDDAADGSVLFTCECGAASARYASYAEGERTLDRHLDEMHEGRSAHLAAWASSQDVEGETHLSFVHYQAPDRRRWEHIAYRVKRLAPMSPFLEEHPRAWSPPREPGRVHQAGLVQVALSRQSLVGVVNQRITALSRRLGLQLERSYGEVCECDAAYCETDSDWFTLIRWDEANPTRTEVYAYVARDNPSNGSVELARFLELTGLTPEDVHFPPQR